jgi:hypothetical protein
MTTAAAMQVVSSVSKPTHPILAVCSARLIALIRLDLHRQSSVDVDFWSMVGAESCVSSAFPFPAEACVAFDP